MGHPCGRLPGFHSVVRVDEIENPTRRKRRPPKTEGFYKQAVKMLRHGFIDMQETDEYEVTPGTSKAQAVRDLKKHGYPIGKELDYNQRTGALTDVRRSGNLARGFDAKDGYDLSRIDEWTPQQKAKVTRLYKVVSRLSARPFQVYRPRKAENLIKVQRAAQHHEFPPELAVAFVPVGHPGERARVRLTEKTVEKKSKKTGKPIMRKGKPVLETRTKIQIMERKVKHTPTLWEDVGLSLKDVADDPVNAVREVVKQIGGKYFTLLAGTTEFRQTFQAEGLEREILRVMNTYDDEWQQFLFGIQAFDMPRVQDLTDYKESKTAAKDAQDIFRQKQKAFFRKMYGTVKKRSKRK